MSLVDFFKLINDEVKTVVASDFKIEVVETDYVPNFDDSSITFDNLDEKVKRCKLLESCVLYVDIRNSASISVSKQPHTLARLYSSFVRSMIAAGRYYGGHVRNIIGDRVMIVFDKKDCYTNAVNTAMLMNSISKHIINKHLKNVDFKCGIGVDYGKMLIVKAGATRRGAETEFYRSLVWLGRPANIASRLTDIANKTITTYENGVQEGLYYPLTKQWSWIPRTYEQFIDNLETNFSRSLKHKDQYFSTFTKTQLGPYTTSFAPILMTEQVYAGFRTANPNASSVRNGWWRKQNTNIREYSGSVYGGDVFFTDVQKV